MVRSIKNTEHYKWGNNCDGWYLLQSDKLTVIEEVMPAGTFENLHYHNRSQQLFYILSGIATFEIEDQITVVKAHESVHIPAQTKHRICNNKKDDLKFLVISEPKSHGDRYEVSSPDIM